MSDTKKVGGDQRLDLGVCKVVEGFLEEQGLKKTVMQFRKEVKVVSNNTITLVKKSENGGEGDNVVSLIHIFDIYNKHIKEEEEKNVKEVVMPEMKQNKKRKRDNDDTQSKNNNNDNNNNDTSNNGGKKKKKKRNRRKRNKN